MADHTDYVVRVGYADTDQGGVVHHSVYLRWLEQGRVEFLRERGVDFRTLEQQLHLTLVVVEAKLRYLRAARFDDVLTVRTHCKDRGVASMVFAYEVRRGDETLTTAEIKLACVALPEGRVQRFPPELLAAVAGA